MDSVSYSAWMQIFLGFADRNFETGDLWIAVSYAYDDRLNEVLFEKALLFHKMELVRTYGPECYFCSGHNVYAFRVLGHGCTRLKTYTYSGLNKGYLGK